MQFDKKKSYVIEGNTARFFLRLAKRLYDDRPLAGDNRRDWANDLMNVHLQRIRELEENAVEPEDERAQRRAPREMQISGGTGSIFHVEGGDKIVIGIRGGSILATVTKATNWRNEEQPNWYIDYVIDIKYKYEKLFDENTVIESEFSGKQGHWQQDLNEGFVLQRWWSACPEHGSDYLPPGQMVMRCHVCESFRPKRWSGITGWVHQTVCANSRNRSANCAERNLPVEKWCSYCLHKALREGRGRP